MIKDKTLIVTIQRADKTVGGMAYRFTMLWQYLDKLYPGKFYLLTTISVCAKFNIPYKEKKNIFIINDGNEFIYKSSVVLISLMLIFITTFNRIKNIHLANIGYQYIPFILLSRLTGKSV